MEVVAAVNVSHPTIFPARYDGAMPTLLNAYVSLVNTALNELTFTLGL